MNRIVWLMPGSLAVLVGLILLLRSDPARRPNSDSVPVQVPLIVFCAASNRPVLEAIRADYEAEFQTPLQIEYGATQTILAAHEISRSGDLFLPADDSYLDQARAKNLIDEALPLARMRAVIAVPKGNPKQFKTLDDLLAEGVRIVQANPEATAIGKLTHEALSRAGTWDRLAARTVALKTTVNEVANDMKVGTADAGIVWDVVLTPMPELEAVRLPELDAIVANVSIAVLKSSQQPQRALHFARYVQAADKGLKKYREFGFEPVAGDAWSVYPELTVYAGAMLRPAIDRTIRDFEQREGVRVTRVYNGCGVLVAQMKAGQTPDAYFACDREFMQQVAELFPSPENVAQNELVILVQKGNPKGIKSLKDLAKPGLRVGVGHEKQCAMGWLTQKTLKAEKVETAVMENVTVQSPSGDMLVNQMRAGSLDAAVAYLSNAAGASEFLDAVRIKGLPCSVATQPFAVAKSTEHRQLATRLLERLKSAESRQRFLDEGFQWQVK